MPKKNGFFYFMLQYQKQEIAKGRRFRNLGEVTPLAGKIWEKMNSREREPYILQANRETKIKKERPQSSRRSETYGKQKKMDEGKEKVDFIKQSIKQRLWQAEMDDGLDKEEFYIISMTYFCRTSVSSYVPAELGVVLFSLECGVKEQLHMLINPGSIPLGSAIDAQDHAKKTHGLPLPPNALGVGDYDEISTKLLRFLKVKQNIPELFTVAKDVPIVQSMLSAILGNHITGKRLYVSSVAELFFELKQSVEYHMMSTTVFPSIAAAQAIIDENEFSFTENISCEYHEPAGMVMECALAKCIILTYIIASNCCNEMGIDLIPGQHIPANWKPHTMKSLLDVSVELQETNDFGDAEGLSESQQRLQSYEERFVDSSGASESQATGSYSSRKTPSLDEMLRQQATK